jgi:Cdc6-like AAA superfamily ATPase
LHLLSVKVLGELRNSYTVLISLLQQAESSYAAKLELLKLEQGEQDEESKRQLEENLKILSTEELLVLQRIMNKMREKNDDVIIVNLQVIPSKDDLYNPTEYDILKKGVSFPKS